MVRAWLSGVVSRAVKKLKRRANGCRSSDLMTDRHTRVTMMPMLIHWDVEKMPYKPRSKVS